MASPAFYERIAQAMPVSACPSGCCEAHYFRLGVQVPAVRAGLCQDCLKDKPLTPGETEGESETVHQAILEKYRKPRVAVRKRVKRPKRTKLEVLRDKAAGVKRCTRCGKEKELFLFPRQSSTTDGRASACSMCLNKNWMNKYYRRNG